MAARVSVVVPIYDVAPYLETCLESLAEQTMADLEILMIDDGATDESPQIAERFAGRDGRFRLVRQENAGLGAARNTGIDHATGEFLAFVDGDDVLPRHAYATLRGALERTGSDFATGNVRRLTSLGTTRATFLGDAFESERLQTHITRFPDLVVDRLACNKLFRRSFWDRHGLRFPEGVRNEDIPVVLPAHHLAGAVDVLAQTVYLWRRREGGDLSGSQRRTGSRALRHRVNAVDHVSRFLADRGMPEAKLAYDRSVLGNDLRYFLDVLDHADDDHHRLFLDLANDFLDRADARALDQPLAIERLKWQLVRRRALPELLEVLRFQSEDLAETPPVRRLGGWYGDYPYRSDRRLRIPRSVYRLEDELDIVARIDDVRWEGTTVQIEGYAYIKGIGAPRRRSQRTDLVAHSGDSKEQPLRLRTKRVRRPDVTAGAAQQFVSLDWAGFVATLDAERLRRGGRWRAGAWEIGIVVRAKGVVRETRRPMPAPLRAAPLAELSVEGAGVRAGLSQAGELTVRVQPRRSHVRSYAFDERALQLHGDVGPVKGDELGLQVCRRDGTATLEYPVRLDRSDDQAGFQARIPLDDLVREVAVADRAAHAEEQGGGVAWDVYLAGDGRRRRLTLDDAAPESTWAQEGRELAVHRTRFGNLTILERSFRPVVTDVAWSHAGTLLLAGSFRRPPGEYDLVVRARRDGEAHSVPVRYDAEAARFEAELTAASVGSLAGPRPLAEGTWELLLRPRRSAPEDAVSVVLDPKLLDGLPVSTRHGRKTLHLGVTGYDAPLLAVERDLDDDERGGFHQRRLRTAFYRAKRRRRLRDAVLYESFGGQAYSDSPRAVHEELVRRDAPFEHLWVVRDAAYRVPATAVGVRELSKEYYAAYARARYVVANDYWPRWPSRRSEQTWLQTWHGAPLKRHGHDLEDRPKAVREYRRALGQGDGSWQYVVSPGAFATPILERAFPFRGEVIETGLPRSDRLFRSDRDRIAGEVKRRLGLPGGKRVILYAPTYRDHLRVRGGYALGPLLDLEALRSALGQDYVVLMRKHRLMVGTLRAETDGIVDVTAFPDLTELLLAVDVLVTDYSSAIFDFAATGRPIVFFVPDLETYRDEIRGFSIDFEQDAPGPLLRTTEDVVEAVRRPEELRAAYRERYDAFTATYLSLVDGRASGRVVERVFHW
jgi:CDP-glycerol glycerophosphotransferase